MIEHVIYADFHNTDTVGRVRLNLQGTASDLQEKELVLSEGLTLTLSDGELSVSGTVRYSHDEKIWVAEMSWPNLK